MKAKPLPLCLLLGVLLLIGFGCRKKTDPANTDPVAKQPTTEKVLTPEQLKIKAVTDSETLLQALSGKMKALAKSFKDASIDSSEFAAAEIDYLGLDAAGLSELIFASEQETSDLSASFDWPVQSAHSGVPFAEIWSPLLSVHRFEDAQIGTLRGAFLNGSDDFEMDTKFEGRIRLDDGRLVGAKGYQTIGWKQVAPDDWKIVSWKQKKLKLITAPEALFENVTAVLVPDPETLKKISTATHQDMIIKRSTQLIGDNGEIAIDESRPEMKSFSDWSSTGQYPSASVVDFDGDGLDDLFLTDRWQPVQLLHNNGDGTFKDVTRESGLDIREFANCGYFFDYDNDGDPDLFVGLSLAPSRFYINEDGVFKPHVAINEVLAETRVVVACSVADVNRDGLLDLYLCTYSSATGPINNWIDQITRPTERVKTRLKIEKANKFVDRRGPPNILLMNRGDRFEWVSISDDLKQYRSSYQSVWTDFDADGDLDLYVCNDFSPDVFLRNDTERGSFKPEFKDVSSELAPGMVMGFGMGASWGDFNNSGHLDLYVSNMFSKAGNRIIAQLDGVDERLHVAARGNFLFENLGTTFKQVAGDGDGQQHVSTVGWSYGGQFADFDNDGELDLYVPSGYFSAPKEIHTDVDL